MLVRDDISLSVEWARLMNWAALLIKTGCHQHRLGRQQDQKPSEDRPNTCAGPKSALFLELGRRTLCPSARVVCRLTFVDPGFF